MSDHLQRSSGGLVIVILAGEDDTGARGQGAAAGCCRLPRRPPADGTIDEQTTLESWRPASTLLDAGDRISGPPGADPVQLSVHLPAGHAVSVGQR